MAFFQGMRQKILIFSLLISILPLLLVAVLGFVHFKRVTENLVTDQLVSIADLKKKELQSWVLNFKKQISFQAQTTAAISLAQDLGKSHKSDFFLQHVIQKYNCHKAYIINQQNQIVASSDKTILHTFMYDEYVEMPLRYSAFYIDDYSLTESGIPIIRFSAPIRYDNGSHVYGVFVLEFDLNAHIFQTVSSWPGMGNSGETLIAKREGEEILFLNNLRHRKQTEEKLKISIDSKMALPAIFSSQGYEGVIRTADYRGQEVLAVYKHLPILNWGFVAKIDVTEALAPVNDMGRLLFFISLMTVFVITLISFLVSQVIITPLKTIEKYSKNLVKGDQKEELKIATGGEIQSLAESILAMEHDLITYQEQALKNEKLAAIGKLSGSVAHDIRNPLGVISNSIYFLQNYRGTDKNSEKFDKHVGLMAKEIGRVNAIISDLLDFSRVNTPQFASEDVNDLLLFSFEEITIPANITIEKELTEQLPCIHVDATQIERVFLNIIENSIDAMPGGGIIYISTRLEGACVEIIVRDEGEGIANENLGNIFEPLFTTKIKGVGLGLSIVQTFITKNNGTIDCASTPGQGTVFTVKFPIISLKADH